MSKTRGRVCTLDKTTEVGGARESLERWDRWRRSHIWNSLKESNGFKTHPVRAVTRPEASLASVGKSESGSVDSGYW